MIDEMTLHERLTDAASAQDGVLVRALEDDLTAGRRRLFRRRLLTGASSAVAVAGVAVAAVGLGGGLRTAADDEAPAAKQETNTTVQTTAAPAVKPPVDVNKLITGLLVKHLDPTGKHLDFSTGPFAFEPGGATIGLQNKVGWKVPGDPGEGMLEIGLTRPGQRGDSCGTLLDGATCQRVTLPNGRSATIGHQGGSVELSYVQPDGETAYVAMNPLFANNTKTPLRSMPVTDAQLIAFVTDPALSLPPITTADREQAVRLASLAPYRTLEERSYAEMLTKQLESQRASGARELRTIAKIATTSGRFQLELTINPLGGCATGLPCKPVTLPDTTKGQYAEGITNGKYIRTAFNPNHNGHQVLVRAVYPTTKPSGGPTKAELLMLACDPLFDYLVR
ncbi:hypothetical protein AB0L70_19700 [Kribbella sp. NPDC051952]|uniref:hypothetical protein n=1 Tax=Kribbella sp. NPDC051952 TaxID=3154851 RepID=UPI00342070F9